MSLDLRPTDVPRYPAFVHDGQVAGVHSRRTDWSIGGGGLLRVAHIGEPIHRVAPGCHNLPSSPTGGQRDSAPTGIRNPTIFTFGVRGWDPANRGNTPAQMVVIRGCGSARTPGDVTRVIPIGDSVTSGVMVNLG